MKCKTRGIITATFGKDLLQKEVITKLPMTVFTQVFLSSHSIQPHLAGHNVELY